MKWLKRLFLLGAVAAIGFWWLTRPAPGFDPVAIASMQADPQRGELIYHIGGCASCHVEPEADEAVNPPALGGGIRFETQFGTFIAPNITPHPQRGIGSWSTSEFAHALLNGVSPRGEHYYPAFPYASYTRMLLQDVVDLKAYMDTLPISERENIPHQLPFPFNIRRGLGLWKRLYLKQTPAVVLPDADPELLRGRYLVEGPGHCAECHTPRNLLGGFISDRWLAGAPSPDSDGRIPNITPHATGIGKWTLADIAEYLSSGFTPDYDVVGSSMAEVVENTAHLSDSDRRAVARYLLSIPALEKASSE